MRTSLGAAVAAAMAVIGGGCVDATSPATSSVSDTPDLVVYAINGSPRTYPAGIHLRSRTVLNIDASWAFDIAFDIDAENYVVIHTVRALASELIADLPRVGLQTDDRTFDEIKLAPTAGFTYDSSLTVPLGKTVLVDKIDPGCSEYESAFLGYNIRAKLRVDSVDLSRRAIFVRFLSNPNCGFRSLEVGQPQQ